MLTVSEGSLVGGGIVPVGVGVPVVSPPTLDGEYITWAPFSGILSGSPPRLWGIAGHLVLQRSVACIGCGKPGRLLFCQVDLGWVYWGSNFVLSS